MDRNTEVQFSSSLFDIIKLSMLGFVMYDQNVNNSQIWSFWAPIQKKCSLGGGGGDDSQKVTSYQNWTWALGLHEIQQPTAETNISKNVKLTEQL